MKPFDKDQFSVTVPVWTECDKGKRELLKELIKFNLQAYSKNVMIIFQAGGLEINSSNYKITANDPKDSIVLKKWSKDTSIDVINFHNHLLVFLNQKNVPSPNLIYFDNGEDYVHYQGNYWTVQSFQEGTFFNGNTRLCKELITQVVNLQSSLEEFHSKYNYTQIREVSYDIDIIGALKNNPPDFDQYFESIHSKLLKDNWGLIVEEYDLANKTLSRYHNKELCHLDLHPHNILVDENSVISFLDFNSVQLINRPIAMAYFALKTCKQICSLNNIESTILGKSFKEQLYLSSAEIKNVVTSQDISYLANSEVIRRICIILKLSIESDDNRWNHVLPILINHLTESKMLFRV